MLWKRIGLVGVLLAVIGLSTISRGRLNENENIFDILPQSPDFANYRELVRIFRPDNKAFFLLKKSGADVDEGKLIQAADDLAAGLTQAVKNNARLFPRVVYCLDIDPMEAVDFFLARQGIFFDQAMQEKISLRLNSAWLSERFTAIKKQLLNSPAPGMLRVVANDPLDVCGDHFRTLQELSQGQEKVTLHRGRLFSGDLSTILIMAEPAGEIADVEQARDLVQQVKLIFASVRKNHAGIDVAWMSGQRFSVENSQIIRNDVGRIFLVSMILIFFWLWLALRQVRSVMILAMPSIFGFALALFLVSLTNNTISIMAVGMASILLGITDDYGIYILCYGRESGNARQAAGVIRHPLFMAVATTVIAFAALIFSRITILRQLGEMATYAIIGSAVFALYFMPMLISWFGLEKVQDTGMDVGRVQRRLLELTPARSLLLLVSLSLLLVPGLARLTVEDDLQSFNAVSKGFQRDIKEIGKILPMDQKTVYAVAGADNMQGALQLNRDLDLELGRLQKDGALKGISSIAAILPPRSQQAANLERWRKFWDGGNKNILAVALKKAAADSGVSFPVFQPYLQQLDSGEVQPLDNGDLPPSLQELVDEYLRSRAGKTYVLTRITPAENSDIEALMEHLRRWNPKLIVADMGVIRTRTMRLFIDGLLKLSVLIFGLIILFLLAFLRDIRRCLAIVLPLLLASLWTLGLLGWLRVKIDASSCMISIIIFGVIIDYSIYITDSIKRGTFGALPVALTLSWFSTMIGFGALLIARHPVLKAFGITTVVSTFCGWLAVSLSSFIYMRLQKNRNEVKK
jgi:predicted exporter